MPMSAMQPSVTGWFPPHHWEVGAKNMAVSVAFIAFARVAARAGCGVCIENKAHGGPYRIAHHERSTSSYLRYS